MELVQEQIDFIPWFFNSKERVNVLTGYAGSGKTTVMRELYTCLDTKSVLWCSPSHQAKNILNKALNIEIACTLSSALGLAPDKFWNFVPRYRNKINGYHTFVVDEASMINEEQLQWILNTNVKKILFVGDPGQLPPVKKITSPVFEKGYNTWKLEEIHRQNNDSPILNFATDVRKTQGKRPIKNKIQVWEYNPENISAFYKKHPKGIAVCATHDVKDYCNKIARSNGNNNFFVKNEMLFLESPVKPPYGPQNGDRVKIINEPEKVNFMGFNVWKMEIENGYEIYVPEGEEPGHSERKKIIKYRKNLEYEHKNTTLMRQNEIEKELTILNNNIVFASHGFAMTIHKSQGSTFKHVLFCTPGMAVFNKRTRTRMAYTAITRASEILILCGG